VVHVFHYVTPDAFPLRLRVALYLTVSIIIASISRQRSEEVREADERYRALVELCPDGIAIVDETGKILFANSALARILGAADAASVIGRNSLDFTPPDQHEATARRIEQLMSGQPVPWKPTQWIRLDGSVVQVESSGVPLHRGGKVFAQGFVRDLTERTEREEKLEESRRRLQALFHSAIDSILFFDSDGRFVDANPAATTLLGYSRDELVQSAPKDLGAVGAQTTKLFHDILTAGSASGEDTLVRKDGTSREIEYRGVANVMPDLHFVILHDITERKDAERSLQQLSGRMLGLQDEERRRIARQLHDTTAQNLTVLKLNLANIARGMAADSGFREIVDESMTLTNESIAEVRTLSYLLHPPLIDEADLVATLRWFVGGFQKRSGIKVTLDVADDLARLPRETETSLFRIIQEALTNVQRHSNSTVAHIRLHADAERIHLEIVDEGTGIPGNLRGNEAALVASGVGIAGIRQRARDLGGEVRIESSSSGTRVTVVAPTGRAN
jgi:PAS domain S-box-containing protein